MSGLALKSKEQVLEALDDSLSSPDHFYVWDGVDDEDMPATKEELQAGLNEARRGRGRPSGTSKTSVSLRIDTDILDIFRATGKGWQTLVNAELRKSATQIQAKARG